MNEPSKAWGEQWLDAQQAMWKAAFPGMPTPLWLNSYAEK